MDDDVHILPAMAWKRSGVQFPTAPPNSPRSQCLGLISFSGTGRSGSNVGSNESGPPKRSSRSFTSKWVARVLREIADTGASASASRRHQGVLRFLGRREDSGQVEANERVDRKGRPGMTRTGRRALTRTNLPGSFCVLDNGSHLSETWAAALFAIPVGVGPRC